MLRNATLLASYSLMPLILACTVDTEPKVEDQGASDTYEQTVVSGMIGGSAWTMAGGSVIPHFDHGKDDIYTISLYSAAFEDACSDSEAPDKKSVVWAADMVVGETKFGLDAANGTFYDQSSGTLVINASFDGKYSVDSRC